MSDDHPIADRLVGHVVRVDAIGTTMRHPIACRAVRKAVDCPHWHALKQCAVEGLDGRGLYLADLRADGLHLLPIGHNPTSGIAREIGTFLDAYVHEVGDLGPSAVRTWLTQRTGDES